MTKRTAIIFLQFFLIGFAYHVEAQTIPLARNWQLLDYRQDHVYGISMEKTYRELLKGKKSKTVVVAVIDSGIDTLHEDLKTILWHNPLKKGNRKSRNGNRISGDLFGWNFIGNAKDPQLNVTKDSEESIRYYFKYKDRFAHVKSSEQLKKQDRILYSNWLNSRSIILKSTDVQKKTDLLSSFLQEYSNLDSIFRKELKKEVYTLKDIEAYQSDNQQLIGIKYFYIGIFSNVKTGETNISLPKTIQHVIDSLKLQVKLPDTPPEDYRGAIVNDNYSDFKDRYYGNSNVMAGDHRHGTHVSGIIGAVRGNGLGMDGVADNVRIMMVRVVPDGDEHDKDVALAIRYAVDNGAKIINMSFGKNFSPEQKWIEKAIRYAGRKNVLLVKAAGNSSCNVDSITHYPTALYLKGKRKASNIITVGASGPYTQGLIAEFSNYGKEMVDVFAPGVQIYSTFPGGNHYRNMDGTSMAAPVVTGLAAVLKSYYPNLSAKKLKWIIESSVMKINEPVKKPHANEKVKMHELCRTNGIVNAYEAVKLAEKIK